MFTGIIKDIGKIESIRSNTEGVEFLISSEKLINQMEIDDSVAVNGVCQTIISVEKNIFKVQAVHMTLDKTTFKDLRPGNRVNLELALRPLDRLGGHFVSGHVNGVATISSLKNIGENYLLKLKISSENDMKYLVKEGSITLEGVSLTVSEIFKEEFSIEISLIPHTWENTIFSLKKVGSALNYEVDLLAKYVENLLFYNDPSKKQNNSISEMWLKEKGF